jgi:prepilin-type N-terminal cleavage/methylation domain-containing protein/prepilin-type processing-associated H-X9-DG protein
MNCGSKTNVFRYRIARQGVGAGGLCFRAARNAFTLAECLVVIGIIGIVFSLLLPAVQAARDASRRVACDNRLRQLGIAIQNFESTHRSLPTNGWGFQWMGVRDLGVGAGQPGGWVYCLLPFLEAGAVAELAPTAAQVANRSASINALSGALLPVLECPMRPQLAPEQRDEVRFRVYGYLEQEPYTVSGYAASYGSLPGIVTHAGPANIESAPRYEWPRVFSNGLFFPRSQVRFADVTDGLSHTIAIGERWQPSTISAQGRAGNQSMFSGDCVDIVRTTYFPLARNGSRLGSPFGFGSDHYDGCGFAFADGHVARFSYASDPFVFRAVGSRNGGEVEGEAE